MLLSVRCIGDNAFSKSGFQCPLYAFNLVLIPHHRVPVCRRTVCVYFLHNCLTSCLLVFLRCFLCPCVHLCPPDTPTTLPPSTTPPLHPNPADHTVLLGTRASDPALTGNRGTVPPHTSPRPFCMILYVSLCASPAVQLSECFLLPCKRSFYVPPSAAPF